MKAKMPSSQKPPEAGEYVCIWCDTTFDYKSGDLMCPVCGNGNRRDLIPIHMEDNPQEDQLYTPSDWHGG